MVTSLNTNQQL